MESEHSEDKRVTTALERRFVKWKRASIAISIVFAVGIAALVPFLAGHSLHYLWESVGKKLLLFCMFTMLVWVCVLAGTYDLWSFLRRSHKGDAHPNEP